MNITEEQTAVESRLAEIENEMSLAHRDHAFEYWWTTCKNCDMLMRRQLAKEAFNRAHGIYCHEARIKIERTPFAQMYALYAIGVVTGMIISFVTFFFVIQPN
jgi:hypothetical protein